MRRLQDRFASVLSASRRGFSLIEVMAALVIFSVAIVGIIEGVGTALTFQADLSMRQRAAMLASNVLEEIRYGNDLAEGDDSGQFDGDDASFMWSTVIAESEWPGLMEVTATVSWGRQDSPKEYAITTLMYDQGLGAEEQGLEQPGQSTQNPTTDVPQMPPQGGQQ